MMLSQSLRELTADALIARQQYQQIPPKVEYRITPAGAELIPTVELLNAWAAKNRKGD
jgi:DNA-binding HxlR family transcriptional regulator